MARHKRPPRKERKANLRDLSQPLRQLTYEVFRDSAGMRLDQFCAEQLPWRSKTHLQRWISEKKITIKGRKTSKKSTRVQYGDTVCLWIPAPTEDIRHEQIAQELQYLHEDDDFVAVNKPPALVCHPVGSTRYNTLIQALHWLYRHGPGKPKQNQRQAIPKICHRLDRDTSGVMIVAKNDEARRRIQDIFETRVLVKRYQALVWGTVEKEEQVVEQPIGSDPHSENSMKMAVVEGGQRARSIVRRLQSYQIGELEISHCEITIETGRQHQIRVHTAYLGHPILCDTLYGPGETRILDANGNVLLDRQALHSHTLKLPHPASLGSDKPREVELIAPLPADIKAVKQALEQQQQIVLDNAGSETDSTRNCHDDETSPSDSSSAGEPADM